MAHPIRRSAAKLGALSRNPTGSCRGGGKNLINLGRTLTLLDPLCQHTQAQSLYASDGLLAGSAVSQCAGNLRNLSDPAAILPFARFRR